jgi:two-component system, NarL family, sensor kinase
MEKEVAIEQERTKMARELHDGLGSMLSGIKHSFSAMTKDFNLNDKQELLFHANLDKLNESIKELRNISHNMASDSLLKYGLENSLRDYCNNASLNSGIPVSFTALDTKDLKITEEKSVHIFRIIQELFQNIINHSNAKNVVVQISNNNKHLYITVEDDGKGFDLAETKKRDGIGLRNIESRVKILKGDLDYKTSPGKGTSVLMTIPNY